MINFKTSDFYYELPERLIAQTPIKERDHSRLLVLDKKTGKIEHKNFFNLTEYLNAGDCLVINDTKVLPARLFGNKKDTKALIEILLLRRIDDKQWEILVKPGKKARIGTEIVFEEKLLTGKIVDILEEGNRIIKFEYEGIFEEILDKLGEMPLPPYIHEKLQDKDRYQTIYAKHLGSAAAPTAGLHFNDRLLEEIEKQDVNIARLTLHVGLGTFRPVKTEYINEHIMHSEYFELNKSEANKINTAKQTGHKVITVGTTSVRTLETIADDEGIVNESKGWTNIFIYPGYKYKVVDSLVTNFHLPESTLIMLVSALAGKENIMKAYSEAVEKEYRFFSFGDAMYIK
ncbi:MAG: tRNA preQ1(34) S-adenosylmethionine ribosyltransferase-isomerase QueA [Tissierellia bacterium]|jgi:S-adenosylmethionine:tRNA ribosyltransferase-isomerase|nr:tRNA preQ1(34) S-adenosylmethionine ribosyltransferase-isomerase QueA [Tissierellia bacterium]MDD3226376.1 tRNA preQ1(34) S-adenosylmethionine ribosyltransferase-isomerase QueA [Tissierellia bacterium]MDD3751262.1 tRNA preQ1(34) S-adenosylmethionine ribosyltransferase-isomerase QueA [Tissierellia bacterium]MDD4046031.1 tRNA preQ1(34) S-adenosylmethionine ribosyltransferase-isomerase QueA [Tissierellia bacterium]MDD4677890.1 tRNA preQ1(34) S-adenosylmethionine ribosyltransferase-isomerase Que